MSHTIEAKINEIIAKRKQKLPQIIEREKSIRACMEIVQKIERVKSQVIDAQGNIIPNTKYSDLFLNNQKAFLALSGFSGESFIRYSTALLEEYAVLKERFSRDYVNIAVVGPARQGKSKFLQSISGLDDRCIPALSGRHCTGASSTVENGNNDAVFAEITYKTEKEVLAEIQGYIDVITDHHETLFSLEQLAGFTKETLVGWMNQYYKEKNNFKIKSDIDLVYERYIDKRAYEQWRPFVGKTPEVLSDTEEIMQCVAQHDQTNSINFFKFVAVKNARIVKGFKYPDCGKIKMVDTVGLGSIEKNTQQNMINTIKRESDGVVFFKRPEGAVTGYNDEADVKIYDELKSDFYDRKMEKWFAYILNHTKASEDYSDNMNTCLNEKEKLTDGAIPWMSVNIVDVSDVEAVQNEFLVPYLTALSNNIDEIDEVFIEDTQKAALLSFDEYTALCNAFNKVMKFKATGGNAAYDEERFEELLNSMFDKCSTLNNYYAAEKDKECTILYKRCEEIIQNIATNESPTIQEVQAYAGAHMPPSDVYGHYIDLARASLTKRFNSIDTDMSALVNELKNAFARILAVDGRLECIVPLSADEEPYVWLKRFSEYLGDEELAEIKAGIDLLADFTFSVRGFMMYRVRSTMFAISRANPNLLYKNFLGGTKEKAVVHYVYSELKKLQNNLRESLTDFYTAPNEALYAISDEFVDRISRNENIVKAWRKLYLSDKNKVRVWQTEISNERRGEKDMEEWFDMWEELQKYNAKNSFCLSVR